MVLEDEFHIPGNTLCRCEGSVLGGNYDLDVGSKKGATKNCKDFDTAVCKLQCFHFTSHIPCQPLHHDW